MRSPLLLVILLGAVSCESQTTTTSTTGPAGQPAAAGVSPEKLLAELGPAAKPAIVPVQGGQVDWTAGRIIAIGTAKMAGRSANDVAMARRAARLVAARNAVLMMYSLPMDASGRFRSLKDANISVDAVLRDFDETASDHDPAANTVTSKISIPMYGSNGVVRLSGAARAQERALWDWPAGAAPTAQDSPQAGKLTLVVIDARKVNFRPAAHPEVLFQGKVVFRGGAGPQQPVMCLSALDLPTGEADKTLVLTPSAGTVGRVDLSDKDTADLKSHPEARQLMQSGRLVILISTEVKAEQ